jgi:hypothetical protein
VELVLAFFNVNEDGETYDVHADLDSAVKILEEFPNDSVVIVRVTPACLRYLTDENYDTASALMDGMTASEYERATENEEEGDQE